MTPNNNLYILPFYSSVSKQNHRKDYAFDEVFALFTPDRMMLPFQIVRPTSPGAIVHVHMYYPSGTFFLDITTAMIDTGLEIIPYVSDGYDIIKYRGVLPMGSIATPEGRWYIEIYDGSNTWYSEMFTTVLDMDQYLKITYWDTDDIELPFGKIDFADQFKFNVYLPTQVGRPEYAFEEEVQNRDGYQYVEKQISEKIYKFNFVAPEYLLDAMRLIRMMDNIEIYCKGETYDIDQFLMTPKWEDGGYLASVEAEFHCDTVIKKIGRGFEIANKGEFNGDFNDDYDIT